MTGYPEYNAAGFAAAAKWVTEKGWTPVSPHDTDPSHDGPCPPGEKHKGHPNACWYTAGLRALAGCDMIVMLPDWEASTGARLEYTEAGRLGIEVVLFVPAEPAAAESGEWFE
jgi:hypothetical protein